MLFLLPSFLLFSFSSCLNRPNVPNIMVGNMRPIGIGKSTSKDRWLMKILHLNLVHFLDLQLRLPHIYDPWECVHKSLLHMKVTVNCTQILFISTLEGFLKRSVSHFQEINYQTHILLDITNILKFYHHKD